MKGDSLTRTISRAPRARRLLPWLLLASLIVSLGLFRAYPEPEEPSDGDQVSLLPRLSFSRLAPPSYYFDNAYLDSTGTIPAYPYETADTLAEVRLYVTVRYQDPRSLPLGMLMPADTLYAADSLRVMPRFRPDNIMYLIKRPPGYDLSMLIYSTVEKISCQKLYDLIAAALEKKLPLWYDPNDYFRNPVPRIKPRHRPESDPLDPPQLVFREGSGRGYRGEIKGM